jgi:hypothetical protein
MRMSAKATLVIVAVAAALAQSGAGEPEPTVALPAPAADVASGFLEAFTRNDREAISSMLPKELKNLYGPCPFAAGPDLTKPRVDKRVGALDFRGPAADTGLPPKGIIVLRLVEENGVRAWRIRQVYWYEELPPEADIPETSRSAEDRLEEPKLVQAADEFIEAWLRADYERMDELTFHWWRVPRKPPRWVKMTEARLTGRPTELDGLRIDFVAKVRFLRVIPRDIHGNLWLVEEEGKWRVRPLTFSFEF